MTFEREESPLERAQLTLGLAQPGGWCVHPGCVHISTLRFAGGRWWCFRCRVAWLPDGRSDQLTAAMTRQAEDQPTCPDHGGHLEPLTRGPWCASGQHFATALPAPLTQ